MTWEQGPFRHETEIRPLPALLPRSERTGIRPARARCAVAGRAAPRALESVAAPESLGPADRAAAAGPESRERMRIALFITCVNDTLYPGTGRSVVRLLRRLGHEVVFPESQPCCGQMHYTTGYLR